MTGIGTLLGVAIDAADIKALAAFYAALTGWKAVREDEDWITLRADDGQEVAFQRAPEHVAPKWPGQELPQQFHLDLQVTEREVWARRAVELGATRLADGQRWTTLADPAGHPFDLCEREGLGDELVLFAVTVDAPDAVGLAGFYAALLGMEVTYEGPEGAFITGQGQNVLFQQIGEYTPPRWPDPAAPQQAHFDVKVDDLDAGEAMALELGAARLPSGGETFRVFADPAGHPFCLTV